MYTKQREVWLVCTSHVERSVILSEANHSLANDSRVEGPAGTRIGEKLGHYFAGEGARATLPNYASGTGGQPENSLRKALPM